MAVALSTPLVGCGDGRPTPYPVHGAVLVNGKPATGAVVTLIPDNPPDSELRVPKPMAEVDASGKFEVGTYEPGDGAPAGGYGLSILWIENVDPTADPESVPVVDRLDGRYADPQTTGLTVEIKEEDNDLGNIELKM